jgi:hypothetical protein
MFVPSNKLLNTGTSGLTAGAQLRCERARFNAKRDSPGLLQAVPGCCSLQINFAKSFANPRVNGEGLFKTGFSTGFLGWCLCTFKDKKSERANLPVIKSSEQ